MNAPAELTETPVLQPPERASEEAIQAVAAALGHNHIEAIVVDTAAEARERVLALVPEGSEVHWAKSKTLDDLGLTETFLDTARFDPVRPQYMALDRKTQGREIRKISAAPDIMLGSVQAVTRDGALVTASYSGSQIGPYAMGAGRVILVVGSQKIVPDLAAALRRLEETVIPYEDARLREQMGRGTHLAKLLVTYMEPMPGRTTVILVRETAGRLTRGGRRPPRRRTRRDRVHGRARAGERRRAEFQASCAVAVLPLAATAAGARIVAPRAGVLGARSVAMISAGARFAAQEVAPSSAIGRADVVEERLVARAQVVLPGLAVR